MPDVHVVWVSFHQGIAHAGYWDEGLIEAAMDGSLWRPAGLPTFVHHDEFDDLPPGVGAVVVVPARWHVEDVARLTARIAPLPYCLLILAGDEQSVFPYSEVVHPNMRVWVQTPRPGLHDGADRLLGDGWPPACREVLAGLGDLAASRELAWSFAGQVNNADRERCHSALVARQTERGDGEVHATRIFGSGLPYGDYLRLLASTKVVPCPAGCFSPDTFRLFEALEAGCVPVAAALAPNEPVDGYWPFLFGVDPPFPVIDDWSRFGEVCDTLTADWPAASNRVFAWWQGVKRRIAHDLVADLSALGALGETIFDPCDHITVLVPTSPIPSHPDTAVLDVTIASVRERLPTAEIIVMIDGVRDEQAQRRGDYAEYVRRLLWKANYEWTNVLPVVFDEHLHQAAMTRRCLEMVRTETVLFVEHDTPLCGEQVPWALFLGAIGGGEVNIIRLHHEAEIHPEHRHLVLDAEPQWVAGVPLLRTVQWSQRPHLARTEFYRRLMATYFGADARSFIEDVLHGILQVAWTEFAERGWRDFRLWMYAPDGDMKRSTHTDGRGEDPKFAMRFAYDGPVPLGAPRPTRPEVEPALPAQPSPVRLGVFGARADRRGLAIQTTEVCRHLAPAAVFGIDMGELSPYPNDWRDYDPATLTVVTNERVNRDMVRDWLTANQLDAVWGAETFYFDWFTGLAAECGVRTVLAPNPEFFSHVAAWLPLPDVLAAPTRWRIGDMPGAVLLPHPVDRQRLPFRHRTEATTFLMVVGHLATRDRQGTRILWEALNHVTKPIRVIVRSQRELSAPHAYGSHIELDVRCGDVADYWDLYAEGDVFLHPRRYGGNDLPLLEALSCGMPVLATDASPQRGFLPPEMLLPCSSDRVFRSLVGDLALHDVNPWALATRIDALASDPAEVARLSLVADEVAQRFSWEAMAPEWEATFERVVRAERLTA